MTDKLICPFCGKELSLEFEPSIMAWCINDKCEHAGVKYSIYVHRILKQATVLQKKLDKAMQDFSQIIEIYRRAYEPWKESCNDMYDVALDAIKAIEDIKG